MSIDSQELGTCVLEENLVHVGAGVLVQLVAAAEDYQGDFTVTEDRQLVGFFHHPELSFVESHLGRKTRLKDFIKV